MHRPLRTFVLALALAATPACAALDPVRIENPLAAARSPDQQAYALLHTYAAALEEASDVIRDPAVPISAKRALGRAERVATPSVEALSIAIVAYARIRADVSGSETSRAAALVVATRRVTQAIDAARGPIAELQRLVRDAS